MVVAASDYFVSTTVLVALLLGLLLGCDNIFVCCVGCIIPAVATLVPIYFTIAQLKPNYHLS